MMIIALIISQLVFSFSRTINVRYTAKENIKMGVITSTIVKITWLVSSSIGIDSMIKLDYFMIIIYIVSGIIGDYLSFKIKIK
jgi:uncharacterized membrane protein (DUF441 family)